MANQQEPTEETPENRGLVDHIGPIKVDWPRSIDYCGGISLVAAAGAIEPPLAIFIAAIPILKMLNRPSASLPERFIGQVLDGAAKPVGGSSEATIELQTAGQSTAGQSTAGQSTAGKPMQRPTMWQEARQVADRARAGRAATS
jgi:hypothetical protein